MTRLAYAVLSISRSTRLNRLERLRAIADRVPMIPLATGLVALLGLWIISPRFSLAGPSLTDDWQAIQLGTSLRTPETLFHPVGLRFRPGWELWNTVQWHTLDGPAGLIGPNLWDVVRLSVLVVGLAALTALLLERRGAGVSRLELTLLIVLPPAAVLAVPDFAVDLARFGPQEPLLVGCMALGATLLVRGARRLGRQGVGRAHQGTALLLAAGYALWTAGAYQKEVSVCALVIVPFLVMGERGAVIHWLRRPKRRADLALAALIVASALPLLHVAAESAYIATQGTLVYGAELEAGSGALGTLKAVAALGALDSLLGLVLLLTSAIVIGIGLGRRRPDWLVLGVFATALATIAWSAQVGVLQGRYLMPAVALLAITVSLSLARTGRRRRLEVLAMLGVFVAVWPYSGHRGVERWVTTEAAGVRLVQTVSRLQTTGCPVVVTGLDWERGDALPVLVGLEGGAVSGGCAKGEAYLVVGPVAPDQALTSLCGRSPSTVGTWQLEGELVHGFHCRGLGPSALAAFARRSMKVSSRA
ncbi:MAG: hypothetical protein QOH73_479 [Gaiellaceae bacterium]|nr:hypothetical protein [Gaiellaceae bacterium]